MELVDIFSFNFLLLPISFWDLVWIFLSRPSERRLFVTLRPAKRRSHRYARGLRVARLSVAGNSKIQLSIVTSHHYLPAPKHWKWPHRWTLRYYMFCGSVHLVCFIWIERFEVFVRLNSLPIWFVLLCTFFQVEFS